jgi:hypothetical protein
VVYPVPVVGRVVYYTAPGTDDGRPAADRPAWVTEIGDDQRTLGLCVVHPTELEFRPLADGGVRPDEQDWSAGTWHWPREERV